MRQRTPHERPTTLGYDSWALNGGAKALLNCQTVASVTYDHPRSPTFYPGSKLRGK